MKSELKTLIASLSVAAWCGFSGAAAASNLVVQGQLDEYGAPANGRFDLQLVAHRNPASDSPLAGTLTLEDVDVRNGQFEISPDFGVKLTPNDVVWIAVAVREGNSLGAFSAIPGRLKAEAPQAIGQCWSSTGDSGVNPNVNFLGTTDGQPLVLRSTAGVAINSNAARDMLTLRGANDFLNGPTIQMLGDAADQSESGRIRFVEGTASTNLRGAYVRYDGAQNLLAIGAHNASDNLPESQVDHMIMRRQAGTQIGIGMAPSETLDVNGAVRINGGIKFAQITTFTKNWAGTQFAEVGETRCRLGGGQVIVKKPGLVIGPCIATSRAEFPSGAVLTQVLTVMQDNSSTQNCTVEVRKIDVSTSGNVLSTLATLTSTGSSGTSVRTAVINAPLALRDTIEFKCETDSDNCGLSGVRIGYEPPNGFVP